MSNSKATWIVTGILAALCFIVFKDYLTFKNAYYFWDICGDGYYNSYPSLCGFADYIAKNGIPSWSFKVGMGQNILPLVFRDPFDIILYLFGSQKIVYLTIYVEVIKIMLSGILFFHYLKLLNLSFYTALAGCMLFAFCGFITEGSAWLIFSFEAFNFAFLLLAFEQLYVKGKWQLFPFAIFLLCISMPFNLYLYGIFIFFYAILRHLQSGKFEFTKLKWFSLKMLGLTILGILLAGPLFLQNVSLLLHSPRGAEGSMFRNEYSSLPVFQLSSTLEIGTAILRFFSNDLLGSGSNYKGWDTILGAPLFYCGLLCLLILPQLFGFADKRLKILFAVFLVVWLLPVVFPFLRRLLWLFAGEYYRGYSFFVAFLVLFYALHALDMIIQKRQIRRTLLIITLLVLSSLLWFPVFIDGNLIDKKIRLFVTCTLAAYSIILLAVPAIRNIRLVQAILLTIIISEVAFSGYITANRRDAFLINWLKEKVIYNDYSLDAVKHIQNADHSFYRIDKNFYPATARYTNLNNSQVQGYNSTASYNSFNQLSYVRFLQTMGVTDKKSEAESRWAVGLVDNPALESGNSVKYFLSVQNYHPQWPEMWDSIATTGDVTIFKNNAVRPFGYTYRHFIKESDFIVASPAQKKFISLQAFVINDKDLHHVAELEEFHLADTTGTELNYDAFKTGIGKPGRDTLSISGFEDTKISGTIDLPETRLIYLSIPFDEGWHIYVNGTEQQKLIVNGGMTGVLLSKGHHKIDLEYKLQFMAAGFGMSILAIGIFFGWNRIRFRKKAEK